MISPKPGSRRVEIPTSLCEFAVARGDITPPVGIYHRMWGAALHDRAEGIHRPLTATVMVFQSMDSPAGGSKQVVVALDHCLLGRLEIESLHNAVEQKTHVSRHDLVVVFSHTHAAGLMSLDRGNVPGGDLIAPYLASVNERVADLLTAAMGQLVPAVITYGTARCNLAAHRDFWDDVSGQWVCGFHPDASADDTVVVARVCREDGSLLATIVNYACHPTTLAWDNRLISPDYPGATREIVEQATGVPCVFLQGASGELGPREGYVGDTSVADRNGRQLGYAALSAMTALPPPAMQFEYAGPVVSGATLGTWRYVEANDALRKAWAQWHVDRDELPIRYRPGLPKLADVEAAQKKWIAEEEAAVRTGNDSLRRDCRAMVERQTRMVARLKALPDGERFPYQLCVWKMGDAVWVAAQGEPYNLLQTSLRAKFPKTTIVVCTLANGWGPSYLPPAELYDTGMYQESVAVLAPGSLEKVIAEAACRIEKML